MAFYEHVYLAGRNLAAAGRRTDRRAEGPDRGQRRQGRQDRVLGPQASPTGSGRTARGTIRCWTSTRPRAAVKEMERQMRSTKTCCATDRARRAARLEGLADAAEARPRRRPRRDRPADARPWRASAANAVRAGSKTRNTDTWPSKTPPPRRPRRPFFRRRKICPFSGANAPKIDYKDVKLLQRYISERGKIVPSRITAVSAMKQRELAKAIKRARFLGLLPYAVREDALSSAGGSERLPAMTLGWPEWSAPLTGASAGQHKESTMKVILLERVGKPATSAT